MSGETGKPSLVAGQSPGNAGGVADLPGLAAETDRILSETGATLASATPDGQNPAGVALAGGGGFDEAGTRAGVGLLVEAVDRGGQWWVESKAVPVFGREGSKEWVDKVAIPDQQKTSAIEAGVALARELNVNVGPGVTLAALGLAYLAQLKLVATSIEKLAESKPKEEKK